MRRKEYFYSSRAQAIILITSLLITSPSLATGVDHCSHARDRFGGIYFRNLFENPGAEEGPASPDGQTVVEVPGWITTGNLTVVAYGTPGEFPGPGDPGSPDRRNNFFAGGPDNAVSSGLQIIDVPEHDTGPIDQNLVYYEMRGWLGGFAAEEDHAFVTVAFKDELQQPLASNQVGPVTAAQRNNQTGFVLAITSGVVPPGTRRIELRLAMRRMNGLYNNGFADDLEIRLVIPLPVEPTTWGGIKASFK